MSDVFRTLLVAAQDVPFASTIAATLGPEGSQGMFQTPVGVNGVPTYGASSGYINALWGQLAPCGTWEEQDGVWVQTAYYPGNPDAIVAACAELGLTVDVAELEGVFARADVSEQEPFVAFGRLGVQIINPPEVGV
jgi:hypothetical protein